MDSFPLLPPVTIENEIFGTFSTRSWGWFLIKENAHKTNIYPCEDSDTISTVSLTTPCLRRLLSFDRCNHYHRETRIDHMSFTWSRKISFSVSLKTTWKQYVPEQQSSVGEILSFLLIFPWKQTSNLDNAYYVWDIWSLVFVEKFCQKILNLGLLEVNFW